MVVIEWSEVLEMNYRRWSKILMIFGLMIIETTRAHGGGVGDSLDTGEELGNLSWVFVGAGLLIFVFIVLSAIWLIRKPRFDSDEPESYMDKVNLFGMNARLYILHIQGMSLTYGVRTIVYNIYLLYIFRDDVYIFGRSFETIFFIGLLLAIGSVVTGIMAPYNGIVVDKLGKKWSFILGDFFGAVTILLIIFFQVPSFVIAMQIIRSAVMSIHGIAEGPFIYEQSSDKERVHLFSVSSGMSTLASMSGNLAGGVVPLAIALIFFSSAIVSGLQSVFVLQVALFVSVLLWWLSLVPAFFMHEDPELRARANQHSISAKLSFKNVTNWRTIGIFVLSSIFIGTGAGLFVSFFSIYFLEVYQASTFEIAMIFALGSLLVAGGNFLSPVLAEKYGKVNTLVWSRYASIVFIILLPLSPILWVAGLFYLLRISFMVGTFPTESALAMETVNDAERTTMEALRMAGSSIFSALGFLAGGYFIGTEQYATPFFIAAVLYFIATTAFFIYFKGGNDVKLALKVKDQSDIIPSY